MDIETLDRCDLCGSRQVDVLDGASNMCGCASCGYVFDNPRPTAAAITAFYSRPTKYDAWVDAEAPRDALWRRRVRKLAPTRKRGSLLDVGAGIGQFLHHARGAYTAVHGTEVSRRAIEIARERYGLTLSEGQIETIDFGDQRFDNITLFHVLEHVPHPRTVVERCLSLLTPGGILAIAVPNDLLTLRGKRDKLGGLVARLRAGGAARVRTPGLPRITLDGSMDEIHLSHFTPIVLQRFLESCGLRILENDLDPFYVASGATKAREDVVYTGCRLLRAATGVNVYETIWITAQAGAGFPGSS
jgi:SAM-dependent methyltransferase